MLSVSPELRVLFRTCEFHTVPRSQHFAASKLCQHFLTPTGTAQTEREVYKKIVDLFILTPSLGYGFGEDPKKCVFWHEVAPGQALNELSQLLMENQGVLFQNQEFEPSVVKEGDLRIKRCQLI